MKELPPGIRLVRTKLIQFKRHHFSPKKKLKPLQGGTRPTPVVSFPSLRSPLALLRQRTLEGWKRLETQAVRINQLSAELEEAMLEFKAIASEVNRDWRAIQATQEPTSAVADICEYQSVNVPNAHQKSSGSFVLTSRTVDLFKAEREAEVLAQTLRRRAKRRRGKD